MATIHRTQVDASTEFIVDSIVLTSDVLHSIRNNLPILDEKQSTHKVRKIVPTAPRWFALTAGMVLCAGSLVAGGMALSAPVPVPALDIQPAQSVVFSSIATASAVDPDVLIRSQLDQGNYKSAAALMVAQPETDAESDRALVYTLALAGEPKKAYERFAQLQVASPELLDHVISHDPEVRDIVIDTTFSELRAYDSKTTSFTTQMENKTWVFLPGDTGKKSVANYRNCRISTCDESKKAAYPATVDRATFDTLFDRVGTPAQDSARSWVRELPFNKQGKLRGTLVVQ